MCNMHVSRTFSTDAEFDSGIGKRTVSLADEPVNSRTREAFWGAADFLAEMRSRS
jgi:hypothetical protein